MGLQRFLEKEKTKEDLLRCRKGGKAKMVQILYSIALLSRPLVSMETRALRRAKWKVASTSAVFPPPAVFLTITTWIDIWTGKGKDKKNFYKLPYQWESEKGCRACLRRGRQAATLLELLKCFTSGETVQQITPWSHVKLLYSVRFPGSYNILVIFLLKHLTLGEIWGGEGVSWSPNYVSDIHLSIDKYKRYSGAIC